MTTSRTSGIVLGAALAATAFAGARPARAADDLPPAIEGVGAGAPVREHRWQIAAGGRVSLLRSAGYDPFSMDDAFGMFSITALRSLPMGGGLAAAGGLLWEGGSSTAEARGGSADLSMTRAAIVLEQRFAPRPWAYAFARLSPGWLRGRATLTDSASPAPLVTSFSTVAVDASLGAAGKLNARSRSGVGIWGIADAGYGWAPTQHLALAPNLSAPDRAKAGVTNLGDLAPRGLFLRLGLSLSF